METLSEQIRNRYFEDTNKTEGYFMSKDVKEFIKDKRKLASNRLKVYWDKIQDILGEKEKGNSSIDLDIQFKIYNNLIQEIRKEIKELEELAGDKLC